MSSYGYISKNGAGSGNNPGNFMCSIRCNNRVIASELDAISSILIKNIISNYDDIKEDVVDRYSKV